MTTRRALGAVLVVLAAGLAAAATFMTFRYIELDVGQSEPLRLEEDAWMVSRNDFPGAEQFPQPPRFGLPILVGAVLLALGGILALRAPLARFGALAGAGLLVGTTWSAQEFHDHKVAEFTQTLAPGTEIALKTGDGLLALIVATAVAAVGAVVLQEFPGRAPTPEPAADNDDAVIHQIEGNDDDTPPYGFPVVVEEPEK